LLALITGWILWLFPVAALAPPTVLFFPLDETIPTRLVFRFFPGTALTKNPGSLRAPLADILPLIKDVHDEIQVIALLNACSAMLAVTRPFTNHSAPPFTDILGILISSIVSNRIECLSVHLVDVGQDDFVHLDFKYLELYIAPHNLLIVLELYLMSFYTLSRLESYLYYLPNHEVKITETIELLMMLFCTWQ
jgi:hypothetical protein